MQNQRDVEWTWSGMFWLRKLLVLGAILLTGWLIWWLWQGFDDDTDSADTTPAVVQSDATVTPTPVASAVETPAPSSDFGYTVDAVDANLNAVEPTVNGCLHTYALAENVDMIIADSCDDLRELANDFTWTHESAAAGTEVTSKETGYCPTPTDDCSVRNGILEFSSWADSTDAAYVDVRIVSTEASDEIENVQATYGDVISSIKVQR